MEQLIEQLKAALAETGRELGDTAEAVAAYARERAFHLATIQGQPGFELAVIAERDSILLFAGIQLVDEADAADERVKGILEGGLSVAAGVIKGLLG